MNWQRLDLLSNRFAANCDALATRCPQLAQTLREHHPVMMYFISTAGDRIHIGQLAGQQMNVLPCRLDAAGARRIAAQLFPGGSCNEPALVAGLEQGWLWDALYNLPIDSPGRPGYRSPLYFLCRTVEQFWLALHIHDWRTMLADNRTMLLVGDGAVEQLRQILIENGRLGAPRVSVTIDQPLWPAGMNLDQLNAQVMAQLNQRMAVANDKLKALCAGVDDRALAARLAGGAPLRILGITSLYTTFLQHSMRDWLAGFSSYGHETAMIIENGDHESLNSLVLAEECLRFKPDLILLIDHFRAELGGLPEKTPCVMWIQDYLPNMLTTAAGRAQSPYDFVIGHNRSECISRFGYPTERFLPALVTVNEDRFAPPDLSAEDLRRFECDACYVSHASMPAEMIVQQQIDQNPHAKAFLVDAFDRLRAIYEAGQFVAHPLHIRTIIEEAMRGTRLSLEQSSLQAVCEMFTLRVNNALFRHQTLEWAADMDVNLHLYGNGWEKHPRLARYARGPADNKSVLRKIFACARINLQATPHGAVHQRLLEGLASGGFFLIRYVPGDLLDRLYQPLWDWIVRENIQSDEQIMARATPEIYQLLGQFQRTIGLDPFRLEMKLIEDVRTGADLGFCRCAGTLWPEYDQVAFDTRARLHQHLTYYLKNDSRRREIAASMRQRVLETLTYKAINQRMLKFIVDELTRRATPRIAAA